MWSGASESLDLLLSYPIATLPYHISIILTSTCKHCIIMHHYNHYRYKNESKVESRDNKNTKNKKNRDRDRDRGRGVSK